MKFFVSRAHTSSNDSYILLSKSSQWIKKEILLIGADNSDFKLTDMNTYNKKVKELIFEVETICSKEQLDLQNEIINDKSNENSEVDQLPNQYIFKNNSVDNKIQSSDCVLNSLGSVNEEQNVNNMDSDHSKENFNSSKETQLDQKMNTTPLSRDQVGCDSSKSDNVLRDSNEKLLEYPEETKIVLSESVEHSEDSKRTSRRNSKRKKEFDECCPVCGVTVRLPDLESHFNQEKERLSKISKNLKRSHPVETTTNQTYEEIKKKRENRLTARVARFTARAQNEVKCPVCSLRMSGTSEEINKHVALCIQDEDSNEEIDVDNTEDEGESFEEYEFGDQTRIRPISLVPGGFRALHGQSSTVQASEEDDLNIDVDDTFTFGEPQYSELDVIPDIKCEKDKLDIEQLRKAVLKNSSVQPNILESRKWSKAETNGEVLESSRTGAELDPIVSSLKEKIKDLEDQSQNIKCLICLESYTKPVVSTTCWHVHCEECWLMTMGVKKLCPQCNMIVFPSDLRKIYL